MSWDLLAYRETLDESGKATRRSLGEWGEIKKLVTSQFDVEWKGPFWCATAGNGYSIEINVGGMDSKEGDPVSDISFNVRGGGDPLPVIADFCKRNGLTLHDLTTGGDIDLEKPSAAGYEMFQAHRDDAIERARERYGPPSTASESGPETFTEAQERADRTGYLRDQPFAHLTYTNEKFCNNFVAWTDEMLFTGSVEYDVAASWQADLDEKGFFRIPDKSVRAPGPPIRFQHITRIEVETDRPSLRVRARDTKHTRQTHSIRFADNDRKQAFVETLLETVGRDYRKETDVSPGVLGLLIVPLILAALITGIAYWLFSASVANWIAIVAAGMLAFLALGARSGKAGKEDHYIFTEEG